MPSNASNYNQSLIQRGRITLWIDDSSINNWYKAQSKSGERGRPQQYSDDAVSCMLIVKYIYRLPLRQTQGLIDSLAKLAGWPIKPMSYTQLSRRQKTLKLRELPKQKGPIVLAIDGTGLKLYGEGEWKVRIHGYSKRRSWRKFHIGINVRTQEIVTHKLTDSHTSESKQLADLLQPFKGCVSEVLADAGYDYHDSYDTIIEHDAVPIISPNVNPRHPKKKKGLLRANKPRDYIRWEQEQIGVKEWKEKMGYHRRSLVETFVYRFKQVLGNKLMARLMESQQVEVLLKSHIINKMTKMGIPSTY